MPADMQSQISVPYVPSYDQFRPPSPAKGQCKGKVRSFLPSFVDRAIFRAKPTAHRDIAESRPEGDRATNVDSIATKSHALRRLTKQLGLTETQESRTANGGLRTSFVAVNKERKAAPQALDKAQHHSRAVQEQLNLDHKAMQSEVSEIIQTYDSKLRDMKELNMRQGAQVIKLQSKLFDRDERIAHLEIFEISSPVVESVVRGISARNLESASQADTGSQGWVMEVQVTAEHQSKPQPMVAVERNSTMKHEPERREKLVKRQRTIVHDASERRKDDPFASEPNLAPHRRIRNALADARDRTLATISELKDVRRKKDEQQPSKACHGHQAGFTAFQDVRGLLADAEECGVKTQVTISDMENVCRKEDEQRPSQACHGHQAEFAAYQDQIAALTSERDTLSRELKRTTRMANSNAFLLNSVELQAQCLLSEHDALIVEHQQEKARSQQQIRELETQLEETTASASRVKERCKAERKQRLEVEEQLKLERIQSAQNHGDHLDEMFMLFRENAEQANLIETLNRNFAEQRTTLQKAHIQLDLANNAQAILKRKVRKHLRLSYFVLICSSSRKWRLHPNKLRRTSSRSTVPHRRLKAAFFETSASACRGTDLVKYHTKDPHSSLKRSWRMRKHNLLLPLPALSLRQPPPLTRLMASLHSTPVGCFCVHQNILPSLNRPHEIFPMTPWMSPRRQFSVTVAWTYSWNQART